MLIIRFDIASRESFFEVKNYVETSRRSIVFAGYASSGRGSGSTLLFYYISAAAFGYGAYWFSKRLMNRRRRRGELNNIKDHGGGK